MFHEKIVAAFPGMHVSPAKHSFGKCDRKVWQTDRQTDERTDPYVSLCFAGDTKSLYFEKIPQENLSEKPCFTQRHNAPPYDVTGKGARNCSKKCYVTCVILENLWNGLKQDATGWFSRGNFSKYILFSWKIYIFRNYHAIKRIWNEFSFHTASI